MSFVEILWKYYNKAKGFLILKKSDMFVNKQGI